MEVEAICDALHHSVCSARSRNFHPPSLHFPINHLHPPPINVDSPIFLSHGLFQQHAAPRPLRHLHPLPYFVSIRIPSSGPRPLMELLPEELPEGRVHNQKLPQESSPERHRHSRRPHPHPLPRLLRPGNYGFTSPSSSRPICVLKDCIFSSRAAKDRFFLLVRTASSRPRQTYLYESRAWTPLTRSAAFSRRNAAASSPAQISPP